MLRSASLLALLLLDAASSAHATSSGNGGGSTSSSSTSSNENCTVENYLLFAASATCNTSTVIVFEDPSVYQGVDFSGTVVAEAQSKLQCTQVSNKDIHFDLACDMTSGTPPVTVTCYNSSTGCVGPAVDCNTLDVFPDLGLWLNGTASCHANYRPVTLYLGNKTSKTCSSSSSGSTVGFMISVKRANVLLRLA